MEASSSDAQKQMINMPMIIATKGHSGPKKIEIALKLAEFLKYTLIDEDHIINPYPNPSPYNKLKLYADQCFAIAHKISSVQLKLKLSVIINTPLSQYTHYNKLVQLAKSTGSRLVIIECKGQKDQAHSHYNVEAVPKLSINPTKPFNPEQVVPVLLRVAKSSESVDFEDFKANESKISSSTDDNYGKRDLTEMHVHEFELLDKPRIDCEKLSCNKCLELISGPTYHCIECDDFILHKSCAELPTKDLWWNCPPYLKVNPPRYDFPDLHKCKICRRFSYNCPDCLIQTHLGCGFIPTIFGCPQHEHKLNFIIMPLSYNYEYKCCFCEGFGKSMSYKCFECNYDLHVGCAFPRIDLRNMHAHEFKLLNEPKIGCEKLSCNKCLELISGPTYHCIECDDFILHKSCAELPTEDLRWNCPPYLKVNPPRYDFPELYKCKICQEFSYNCPDCLLQTHLGCGFLPTILEHAVRYERKLNLIIMSKPNLIIMPLSHNYQYKCCQCQGFGKSMSYKYFEYNDDLHVECALPLPRRVDFGIVHEYPKIDGAGSSGGQTQVEDVEKRVGTDHNLIG